MARAQLAALACMPSAQVLATRDAFQVIEAVLPAARVVDRPASRDRSLLSQIDQSIRLRPPAVLSATPVAGILALSFDPRQRRQPS
jgi:hypothetical protein